MHSRVIGGGIPSRRRFIREASTLGLASTLGMHRAAVAE
jgi:hypothetical protein